MFSMDGKRSACACVCHSDDYLGPPCDAQLPGQSWAPSHVPSCVTVPLSNGNKHGVDTTPEGCSNTSLPERPSLSRHRGASPCGCVSHAGRLLPTPKRNRRKHKAETSRVKERGTRFLNFEPNIAWRLKDLSEIQRRFSTKENPALLWAL